MVGDGGLREPELLCDLARLFALREQLGDHCGCEAELRGRGDLPERDVLSGGRVDECGELVDLQERAAWLRHPDAHALAPGGVVIEMAVLDGVLEDHREQIDYLADRGWAEGDPASAPLVADHRSSFDLFAELLRFAQ
ncbi:MAG: hypothetical protein ABR992_00020 [Solirubrobacteraceae bacterium]